MFSATKKPPYIHPSQYQLPMVCRKTRLYCRIVQVVIPLLYLLAIGLTVINSIQRNWEVESILPMFWIWAAALPLFFLYIEPDLVLTDQEIILKFPFKDYHIDWDDVLWIDRSSLPHVYVRKLTLINRLWGITTFSLSLKPCFCVSMHFREKKEIVEFIRFKVNKY
jgi:hypothetical protein